MTLGKEYFCPDGSRRVGALEVPDNRPSCSQEGQVGCVTTDSFRSTSIETLASKVILGQSVAGTPGAVRLPDPSKVLDSESFGVLDSTKGSFVADFPAPGSVLNSETTGGVPGSLILPNASQVQVGITFGPGGSLTGTLLPARPTCASDGQSDCTVPSSGTIKAVETAGLASKVLETESVAGVNGAVVLPAAATVLNGTNYGAASGTVGTYSPDFPDAANVLSVDTRNGETGTYAPDSPDASNVRSSDSVNGSSGTLDDCAADGDEGCVVPLSSAIKAADTSKFSEWDIRHKRASDGALITFAGLTGRNKHCRNRANLTLGPDATNSSDTDLPFNFTAPPGSATLVPDFFDTIDDFNDGQAALPPGIVPWAIPGVAGTHPGDFTCGGIYSTGAKNYSDGAPTATGADGSLLHDPNGNWQDLTPGVVPGGGPSGNTNPGCNATDKFCVFRELTSGLLVTEVSAGYHTWVDAISYCDELGETGGVVEDPLPTLDVGLGTAHSDWRLPTLKELVHLQNASIRGLNQTAALLSSFGDLEMWFWSATSASDGTAVAWNVYLYYGWVFDGLKTNTGRVICVK